MLGRKKVENKGEAVINSVANLATLPRFSDRHLSSKFDREMNLPEGSSFVEDPVEERDLKRTGVELGYPAHIHNKDLTDSQAAALFKLCPSPTKIR